jgi:hypothetical protein
VVHAVTIAMQRLGKQTPNNRATVFRGVRAKELSWIPSALRELKPGVQTRNTRGSPCEDLLCKLKALLGVCDPDYDRVERLACNDCKCVTVL